MRSRSLGSAPAARSPGSRVLVLAAVLSVHAAINAPAQDRPNFSGNWIQVLDSSRTRPSVATTGDAAFRVGDMGSGWGSPLAITQRPDSLIVEYTVFSAYDLQPPLRLVFALDGTETRNAVMIGHTECVQRSTVTWQGTTLVITTTLPAPALGAEPGAVQVRQALTMASPTSLVIEASRLGVLGGPTTVTRTVYRRS